MLSQEWRCSWSSTDRQCSNYIWVIKNLISYQCVTYIRGLTVSLHWLCHVTSYFTTSFAHCPLWRNLEHATASHTITYWRLVTPVCVSKLSHHVFSNGLLPSQHQAIAWPNCKVLFQENTHENVACRMVAIVFLYQRVHVIESTLALHSLVLALVI